MGYPGFRFETGDAVEIDGALYEIMGRSRDGVDLRSLGVERRPRWLSNDEFWNLYYAQRPDSEGRRLVIRRAILGALSNAVATNLHRPLDDFDPRWQAEAAKRLDYVETCDRLFSPSKANRRRRFPKRPEGFARAARLVARLRRRRAAALAGVTSREMSLERVGGSTLRAWYSRWVKSGRDMTAIVPCHDAKGMFGERLDGEVVAILGRWIRDSYLTPERPDAIVAYDCAVDEIGKLNAGRIQKLIAPSYATFLRCLNRWTTPFDRVLAREGAKAAEQKFRHVKRAPRPTRPLEIVEIDHTPLDLLLVDDDGRLSVGDRRRSKKDLRSKNLYRVWLTVARCQATKMIFGFHVSRDCPSWTSVMAALNMGVSTKNLEGIDVRSPWPVFGVPEVLKMDNGPEFHSRSLRAAAGQLRMELRYMPRGKPHLKGGIERTIGTISREFLSFLPGRTFSNPVARGDYHSAGRAAATFEKVNELLTIYFVDVAHNRAMGSLLGRTPLQTWDALAGFGVRMPPNADDLTAILSLVVDRTVTSVGITFLGLVYQSKELQGVRRRVGHLGKLLMVKIDPNDIGSILVMDEGDANRKGKWISVPCIYPELADGVTVAQWKETVALARQETEPGRRVALATLRSARRRLAEEGARLGAKPLNATVNDVDWAREHVDDPDFDVARDSEAGGGRRKRGRPRKVDGQAVDRKVGDGGHLRQPDNDPASLAIADAGAEDAVREVADSGTSGGNDPLPPSEQKQQAADRQSGAGRKRVDYGDPDNWK